MNIFHPDRFDLVISLYEPSQVQALVHDYRSVSKELYRAGTARTHMLNNGSILLEFYDRYAVLFATLEEFHVARNVQFFRRNEEIMRDPGLFGWFIEMNEAEGQQLIEKYNGYELSTYATIYLSRTVWQLCNGQIILLCPLKNKALLFPALQTFLASHTIDFEDYLASELQSEAEEQFFRGEVSEHLYQPHFTITREQVDSIITLHELEKIDSIVDDSSPVSIYYSRAGYYIVITDFSVSDRFNNMRTIGDTWVIDNEEALQEYYRFREDWRKSRNDDNFLLPSTATENTTETNKTVVLLDAEEISHSFECNSEKYITGTVHPFYNLQPKPEKDFPEYTGELIALLPNLLNLKPQPIDFSENSWRRICDSIKWNYAFDNFYEQVTLPLIAYLGEGIRNHLGGHWSMKFSRHYGVWEPYLYLIDGQAAISFFDVQNELWRHRNGDCRPPYIEPFAIWLMSDQ